MQHAPPRGRQKTIAGAVVGAVGVALAGVGIAFGVLAQQASDDITNLDRNRQPYNSSRFQEGLTDQTLEAVFLAGGGAALAAGVVVLALGRREATRPTIAVVPQPSTNGLSCSVAGRF